MSPAEPRRFVILTVPRTGSNMLCTQLNAHPEILCHHELFNPRDIHYALDLGDTGFRLGTIEERERDPLGFLDRVWRHAQGLPCVGFKLNRAQSLAVREAVLHDPNVAKIVLKRRNRIKRYASWLIAQKLDQYWVYRREELIGERPRVEVRIEALMANIRTAADYFTEIERVLHQTGQRAFQVAYEDLFSASTQVQILDYLGVRADASLMRIGSIKQNSDDLRDLIANFDELAWALRDSELAAELHETSDS